MSDLIDRQAAIKILHESEEYDADIPNRADGVRDAIIDIMSLPTIERKKGKWDEQNVFDTEDSDIAQMQSAKCSMCGKYHTTPYLYFFDNFNYCPNCGADMRGEYEEPEINPCRGCTDYAGGGRCRSNGGCGADMRGEDDV